MVACFAETGQYDKILLYSKKVGFQPDFVVLLQHVMRADPEKGAEFATKLINDEMGQHLDLDRVSDRAPSADTSPSRSFANLKYCQL